MLDWKWPFHLAWAGDKRDVVELCFKRPAKSRIYQVDLYPSSGWKTVAEALPLPQHTL